MIKAFACDLFGTLVDTASISKVFLEIGVKLNDPKLFAEIWHSKEIRYALITNATGVKVYRKDLPVTIEC